MNSLCVPAGILDRRLVDKGDEFSIHTGSPCPLRAALPSPVFSKACPVPANDRLGFYNDEGISPFRPAAVQ